MPDRRREDGLRGDGERRSAQLAALWGEALDAVMGPDVARAMILIDQYRAHEAPREHWRELWIAEWAELCERRGEHAAAEAAHREHTVLRPTATAPWIMLGAYLAGVGRLEEAEAAHRHATTLRGDVDEASLNLGLVLRARDRLEEAAEALEHALALCPEYPEASAALADVRGALALRAQTRAAWV